MAENEFRILVLDDDAAMLRALSERVSGISVSIRKRRVDARADTFQVSVVGAAGTPNFADATTTRFLEIARIHYDFVVADYSFASSEMQSKQWNEGADAPTKRESNEHLLTLVDLRDHLVAECRKRGDAEGRLAEAFFARRTPVLVRSFQHDRALDKLGSYEARVDATKGVFSKASRIDRLDGFSLVYGSDPELREELYHGSRNGRRLYRNVVAAMTLQITEAAILRDLARRATVPPIVRSANRIALLVGAVAALATVVQLVTGPMIDAAVAQAWPTFAALALVTLVTAYVGSLLLALLVERGVRRMVGRDNGE